jgi:hypothetical protein
MKGQFEKIYSFSGYYSLKNRCFFMFFNPLTKCKNVIQSAKI